MFRRQRNSFCELNQAANVAKHPFSSSFFEAQARQPKKDHHGALDYSAICFFKSLCAASLHAGAEGKIRITVASFRLYKFQSNNHAAMPKASIPTPAMTAKIWPDSSMAGEPFTSMGESGL